MMNTSIRLNLRTILAFCLVSLLSLQACAKVSTQEGTLKEKGVTAQSQFEDDLTAEELALLADDSRIKISFDSKVLTVEFADSFDERALGLMHRKTLCEDCGMLFQFDSERFASIWMKNTFVPLDLAYITVDGRIVDIRALQPHDLTFVKSPEPVLYALEMNQGWFAKNGITVGDRVSIEGRVKQPQK
jgi:uncharacterized membrane protein (UPF0127 family)